MISMWDVVPDFSVYSYTLPIMIEFTPREWALGRDMALLTAGVTSSMLPQLAFGVVVYPFGGQFEAEPRPSIGITCNNVDGPILVNARVTVVWGQFEDNVNVKSGAFNTAQEHQFNFGRCFDCQDLPLHVFVYLTASVPWHYAIHQAFDLTSFGILYSQKENDPVPSVVQKVDKGVALTPAEKYLSTQLPSSAFAHPLSFDVPTFDTPYLLTVDLNNNTTPIITDDADDYDDTKLYVADCVMIKGAASHLNLQRTFSHIALGNSFLWLSGCVQTYAFYTNVKNLPSFETLKTLNVSGTKDNAPIDLRRIMITFRHIKRLSLLNPTNVPNNWLKSLSSTDRRPQYVELEATKTVMTNLDVGEILNYLSHADEDLTLCFIGDACETDLNDFFEAMELHNSSSGSRLTIILKDCQREFLIERQPYLYFCSDAISPSYFTASFDQIQNIHSPYLTNFLIYKADNIKGIILTQCCDETCLRLQKSIHQNRSLIGNLDLLSKTGEEVCGLLRRLNLWALLEEMIHSTFVTLQSSVYHFRVKQLLIFSFATKLPGITGVLLNYFANLETHYVNYTGITVTLQDAIEAAHQGEFQQTTPKRIVTGYTRDGRILRIQWYTPPYRKED